MEGLLYEKLSQRSGVTDLAEYEREAPVKNSLISSASTYQTRLSGPLSSDSSQNADSHTYTPGELTGLREKT